MYGHNYVLTFPTSFPGSLSYFPSFERTLILTFLEQKECRLFCVKISAKRHCNSTFKAVLVVKFATIM